MEKLRPHLQLLSIFSKPFLKRRPKSSRLKKLHFKRCWNLRFPWAHQEAACARPKSGHSDPLFTVFHIATAIEVKSPGEGCTGHTKREASKRRWKHRCDSGDSRSDARASDKRSRSAACFLKPWYCKFMWTLQGTKKKPFEFVAVNLS